MALELPRFWKKFSKRPWNIDGNDFGYSLYLQVYGFLFFKGKRTLIINKSWDCIGSLDTRNSRHLTEEANELGWIKETRQSYKVPFNMEYYPDVCDEVIIIDSTVRVSS